MISGIYSSHWWKIIEIPFPVLVFQKHFQPDSIRVMGDKSTARETMKKAGVPTVPGSEGLLQV